MARRYRLAIVVVAALSVLVAGAAVAATRALTPEQESQAVINDAAEQLGVQPDELSDALKQALKNRVDAAVEDGRLTEEQGQRMKEKIEAGDAPLFGLGPAPEFRHHFDHGPVPAKFDAAARYLGMTEEELRRALEDGKTLAQVARDRNKSVDGLVDALVARAEQKLARVVAEGRMSEAEKREFLSRLREHLTEVVNGRAPPMFHRDRGPGKIELDVEKLPAVF
jgi:hypothetical protein